MTLKNLKEPFAQAAALQHLIETNIIIVSSKKELAGKLFSIQSLHWADNKEFSIFSEMSQRLTVTNDTIGNLKKELLGKIFKKFFKWSGKRV